MRVEIFFKKSIHNSFYGLMMAGLKYFLITEENVLSILFRQGEGSPKKHLEQFSHRHQGPACQIFIKCPHIITLNIIL